MNKKPRTVIIGLDGMPYGLMEVFGRDGTMPNFGALTEEGVFRPLASSIPEVSSVAWSSVITGQNPGEHGIYGFIDVAPGTYRRTFPNFSNLRAAPFWEGTPERRSVILNVPTTYPARELNGILIAGFVALDLERATYPRSLVPTLQKLKYKVDVDSQKAHQSLSFFLRDLDKTLEARIAVYRHLWSSVAWDTFMLVFTGTDRLAHFLWDAYEDPSHRHHEAFRDHFRKIDLVIGEIADQLDSEDSLLMLSDHGFERLHRNVYLNHVLQDAGLLHFEAGARPGLKALGSKARAFALEPSRIYLNTRERFPRGSVEETDRDPLLAEITEIFESLTDEGERVIKRVFRREELYHGPYAHQAPDLVLLGNSGYNLRASWSASEIFGTDIFSGKHSQADAFLLAWGEKAEESVPKAPNVTDIVGIMDAMRPLYGNS
ncbi:MAG: alkaline phosphatase family protein [Anaerolineae bacterium]